MQKTPKHLLRRAFMDILKGYTKTYHEDFGEFYIKHLDVFDSEEIDEKDEEYKRHAESKGLPTTEEKLKQLKEDGSWDSSDERKISDLELTIKNLQTTKSKLMLKADIENLQKQIDSTKKELDEKKAEKSQLVGYTADIYSSKKINEYYVFSTTYKDKKLKKKLFSEEEFDELSEQDIVKFVSIFNHNSEKTNEDNIKRIALSGFFLNNFYLCKDNPKIYYGKPVIKLTYNQSELFSYGRYFKHILSEMKNKPSPEIMDDPDRLIELYNIGQNSQKMKQSAEDSDASTVVGATKEDLERMGMSSPSEDKGVSLSKEASKKGGKLSMDDLIKLHGM
tara:strand:+ start:64 stop:1068 length:1005 start_codon:yes stop_codon:yes gene_type:complete